MRKQVARRAFSASTISTEQLEAQAAEIFKPTFVTSCVKGKSYFLPAHGVFRCDGTSKVEVAGCGMEVVAFAQVIGEKTTQRQIPVAKIEGFQFRELISKKSLKSLEKIIKRGNSIVSVPSDKAYTNMAFLEAVVKSPNPVILAHLVRFVFSGRQMEPNFLMVGNKALNLLASEYAAVRNVDYGLVLATLSDMAGKATFTDLSRSGTSPYDKRMG